MPTKPHVEEEPWWPDALLRFDQLAATGVTRNVANLILANEFKRHRATFENACNRGSVSAYPSKYAARAAAWQSGQMLYEGAICERHGTMARYAGDGLCLECRKAETARHHTTAV